MKTEHVIVEKYNPQWKDDFNKIAIEIKNCLGKLALRIEHVGSTSVIGLSAKPIIDIDIVIENSMPLKIVSNKLASIGYIDEGDLGIKDREAFCYTGKEHLRSHHLYVCHESSEELKRHCAFRDYLMTHPLDIKKYSEIKEKAAALYPEDIDSYIEYKSPVIQEIYSKIN